MCVVCVCVGGVGARRVCVVCVRRGVQCVCCVYVCVVCTPCLCMCVWGVCVYVFGKGVVSTRLIGLDGTSSAEA